MRGIWWWAALIGITLEASAATEAAAADGGDNNHPSSHPDMTVLARAGDGTADEPVAKGFADDLAALDLRGGTPDPKCVVNGELAQPRIMDVTNLAAGAKGSGDPIGLFEQPSVVGKLAALPVAPLVENTSIGAGIKVADILVTDDALGTDVLSLTGSDAASFEIRNGDELYFIGASPNFEAKASYAVTVNVDDTTVGGTPDASQAFIINITDVNEAPTAVNDVNGGDAVVEQAKNLIGVITFAGDPNAAGNVLTNDSDPDSGDTLSVSGVAAGSGGGTPSTGVGGAVVGTFGTLTVQSSGAWAYVLNNNDPETNNLGQLGQPATGVDTFTYAVSDGHGGLSTALVSITIQGSLDILA